MRDYQNPPCDCAEKTNGRWTFRCECSNRDDGERVAMWCSEANAADEITRLRAEVEHYAEKSQQWQDSQSPYLREITRLTARVALREKVADAIADGWDREGRILHAADAAIDLVLEEAARVAEAHEDDMGHGKGSIIAAAIRALKGA